MKWFVETVLLRGVGTWRSLRGPPIREGIQITGPYELVMLRSAKRTYSGHQDPQAPGRSRVTIYSEFNGYEQITSSLSIVRPELEKT
jgi:hypothetical protein